LQQDRAEIENLKSISLTENKRSKASARD